MFVISTNSPSANGQTIWFGATYLFPPGYAGYNNGDNHLRTDLIEKLIAMKPAFFRVPGGNYLEGEDYANCFNWEATIGPLEDRPGHMDPWGYWSDDGFGLDEYLQMAEAAGAQPVLAIYAGYTLNGSSDTGQTLTDDVTSAVDELHYCLDPVTTTWGAMRAANGHPAPYNVNYVEIGNEDFFSSTYSSRYPLFYTAIKAAFPSLKTIATSSSTGGYPFDVLDEHFYESPQWMINNSNYFASQTRGSYSILVGEYAAMAGAPTETVTAGIGDAAWIMGMMRNSDLVTMASYAPLWVNVNSYQWSPDLIGFNGLGSFGSFSYYAQAMLSNNHGTTVVSSSEGGESGIQTLASQTGSEYYITLLNTNSTSDTSTISLSGLQGLQPTGTAITLASWDGSTNNSLSDPYGISPRTTAITGLGKNASFSYTLPGQSLTILEVKANQIYQWIAAASSSWTTIGNWKDVVTGATLAAPGVRGLSGDTALFASAALSTATLDGASPVLAGITFDNAAMNYTIAQGSGGNVTLHGAGGSSALVQVQAGNDTISAPLVFNGEVAFNAASGGRLTVSGPVIGNGNSISVSGPGTVVLSGAGNKDISSVTVTSGELMIGSSSLLAAGCNLTIGAGTFSGPASVKSSATSAASASSPAGIVAAHVLQAAGTGCSPAATSAAAVPLPALAARIRDQDKSANIQALDYILAEYGKR